MDSGISNSVQSSSGGDEEYDSRADHSISSFLNNHHYPSSVPASGLHQQQQLYPYSLSDHPLPSANYSFDPSSLARLSSSSQLPNNSSLLNNLDHMFWSRSLRSDPNCSDLGVAGLFMNPSTTTSTAPSTSSKASSFLAPPASSSSGGADGLEMEPQQQGHYNNKKQSQSHTQPNHHVVRNTRKRSRASRRAPTTVLTTDTSNFRAMVQEFTGTPAPPFTPSSSLHFPTSIAATTISRFNDLFGAGSNSTSPAQPPPSYLLRPFPHKLNNNNPPIHQSSSSSSSSSAAATTSGTINNINYEPILQNLLLKNLQNNNNNDPVLSLHSLLQLPPNYPLPNETKSSGISLEDQFGLSQQAKLMSGLQSWPAAGTTPAAVGSNESTADHHHHHHQEPAAGVSANGKLMSSFVSSSEFLGDKQGQQAAANNVNGEVATTTTTTTANTRTAGMVVESWIN